MITFLKLGKYGRFANQLYQIAGVIGIAIRSGQPYAFPQWINYDHKERFGSNEDIDIYKHLLNPLPELPQGLQFEERFIQWGYHDVFLPTGNYSIEAHLQSPRYFNHCIDHVREVLKFKNEPPLNDLCAIHYRAGDYIDDNNAYHPRQTKQYYYEAMKKMPGKFLVFSDDIEAAKQIFGSDVDYSEGKDYIEDYKLMKSCKHFIIANSSYSAFAATMANQDSKIVVAPKRWFGEVAGITGDDIYHQTWEVAA